MKEESESAMTLAPCFISMKRLSVDFNRLCNPTAELIFFVGNTDGIAGEKRA